MTPKAPPPPPAPAAASLRPLTMGELIDRGFSLYRANFAGLLLLALLCQIAPLFTSQALIGSIRMMPSQANLSAHPGANLAQDAILLGISILGQVITFCFEVAMTVYISDAYLDRLPSVKAGFSGLMRHFGGAIWTSLLNILLVGLTLLFPFLAVLAAALYRVFHPAPDLPGLLLFITGAVVLFVASLVPVLIVFVRLMATIPAFALEEKSGWSAVRRSAELVRYDPGLGFFYWGEVRISLLLLPLFVIQILASSLASLPATFHQLNELVRHGAVGQFGASTELAVASQVLVLLSNSVLLPLYVIAITLFYYDVRIRREGFDLEFMAGRLEAAP